MCSPQTCRTCSKTTWAGCGMHVAQVKAMVSAGQWCDGHSREQQRRWSWPWATRKQDS